MSLRQGALSQRVSRATIVLTTCALASLLLPATALASPWTLPQHKLVISSDVSFAYANKEYLQDGTYQRYTLGGQLRTTTLGMSFRYGFTDRFEMEVRPSFKQLSYESDPVILDIYTDPFTVDEARARIIDFDSSIIGAADMDVAGRYGLVRSRFLMMAFEGGTKIPLGYKAPQGTFTTLDPANDQFQVGDDATLGDGQIDLRGALLFGTYLPWTRTFARLDLGYNHRFSSPGNQVFANGKIGQYVRPHIIVVGGVRWAQTITEGDPIGKTAVDTQPTTSAADFKFANVELRDLYLDRDFAIWEVGVILQIQQRVEFRVSYEDVFSGKNYADLRAFNVGVSTSFPDATRMQQPELEPSVEEPTEEIIEEVIIVPVEEGEEGEVIEIIEEVVEEGEEGEEIIEEAPRPPLQNKTQPNP